MNNSSKSNDVIERSLLDDENDNLSPLPYGPQNCDLGRMKYSLSNQNSTLDQAILSKFIKYDNSPEQHTKSHNTTEDIAASLGLEQNESVGWTTALETPNIDDRNRKKKILSTIERLTLHPTRELRQSVLARALFAPLFDNNKECSESLISDVQSPLAKNLEKDTSCQLELNRSQSKFSLELDESFKTVIDDTCFDKANEKKLFTESPISDHIKFTSEAMTSTPISLKNGEHKYTNHLRKCLDDAFSKISRSNEINYLVKRNINESINTAEDFCNIAHEQENTHCNVSDKESLNVDANSNSVTLRKANISELTLSNLCSKRGHVDLSSSSNGNSNYKSKLSLKRKKPSKFVYPKSEENLNYENDSNKVVSNFEKISVPSANKFLKHQSNFISLSTDNSYNSPSTISEMSSVVDIGNLKKINQSENVTNNLLNDGSSLIAVKLSPCGIIKKDIGFQKLISTEENKEDNFILSEQDTSFLRFSSQIEKDVNKLYVENSSLANDEFKNSPKSKAKESANQKEKLPFAPNFLNSCQEIFQSRLEELDVVLKASPSEGANEDVVETVTNSKYPDKFTGFLNGSGKIVGVSDISLKNVKNIWDEQHLNMDSDETTLAAINLTQAFMDCKSKDVALNASEIGCNINNKSNQTRVNGVCKSLTGFQSGSGKKLCVSDAFLRNGQKLWNECSQPDENSENFKSKTNTGFQTVSGKKITVAGNSLKLVQTMWEECGKSDENLCNFIDPSQSSKIGASTSHAKPVTLCAFEGNLSNSFCPANFDNHDNNSLVPHRTRECNEATGNFIEGKEFVTLFNNFEQSSTPREGLKFQGAENLKIVEKLSNFQTDKDMKLGKEVNLNYQISFDDHGKLDDNLVFKNKIFLPLKDQTKGNDFEQSQKEVYLVPKLFFQTASNKPVEISKVALLKAKSLWNNTNEDNNIKEFDSPICRHDGVENMVVKVTAEQSCTKADERSLSPVFGSFRTKRPTSKSKFKRRSLVSEFDCRSKLDKHDSEGKNNNDINSRQLSKIQFVTCHGKSLDIQEESVLLAKNLLNQEPVNEKYINLNENDHSMEVSREVPNISTIVDCENKLSNKSLSKLNAHLFLETQDFIEITKISEAFMLDNSWDDLSQSHKQRPHSISKRNSAETESGLTDHVKTKRKKLDDASDLDSENVKNSVEMPSKKKDELVWSKSKEIVQNTHGSLFQIKGDKNVSKVKLSSINLNEGAGESGHPVEKIMPHNATSWRFGMNNETCSLTVCYDGFNVIPGCDNKIGVKEIEKAFLSSPVVNSSLVPAKWILNHYKWIIWKLASYQRKLDCFSQKPFSLIEIIKQLRYRYDVEILEGRRSVIRKIFEQDDLPQKTMILCVSEINNDPNNSDGHLSPIVLTDGWYSIGAQIDCSMKNLLHRNIIKLGYKLILHGSELNGTPSPCHPLENNERVTLKIHTNMIRLVNWHSKLGLYKCGGPIPSTSIACLLDGGGHVGTLDVIVARKYPLIYMEKVCGKTVMYNERAHDKKTQDTEMLKQTLLQDIYSQVAKDLEDEESEKTELDFIKDLPNQKEIYKNISLVNDSNNLESLLTPEQLMEVHKWRQQKSNERNIAIQNEVQKRFEAQNKLCETVPMLKLGVVDKNGNYAIVAIWRPQEDILPLLKEGKSYKIHFVTAAETRNGIKQLTWNKHSRIMEINDIKLKNSTHHRKVTPIDHINSIDANNVPWSEMDVVGVVVRVCEPSDGRQIVYLADQCANLLSLKFWPSVQDFGMSNVLEVGACVPVCNAGWKGKCEGTPTLHITSHTVISSSPSKQYLQEAIQNVIGKIQDISQFLTTANTKIGGTYKEVTNMPETIKQQLSPKFKSIEIKRSKEIEGKLNALTKHYGILSPIQTFQMKSSPLITKPFKVPLRYGKSPSCGK